MALIKEDHTGFKHFEKGKFLRFVIHLDKAHNIPMDKLRFEFNDENEKSFIISSIKTPFFVIHRTGKGGAWQNKIHHKTWAFQAQPSLH